VTVRSLGKESHSSYNILKTDNLQVLSAYTQFCIFWGLEHQWMFTFVQKPDKS